MTRSHISDDAPDEARRRGLAKMSEVYGWEVSDGPGDYFELDGHFTASGQRRLGEAVSRSIRP